jgi:very-short-patch-repair endonuclease
MFTVFFTGPRRPRPEPHCAIEDRLRRLLQSRSLHPHRFSARCEIGPFVVAHVCRERSLVVELLAQAEQRERQQQRALFLAEFGYTVLRVCPRELRRHPRRVLRRVRAALRPAGR